jgi:hypothetical protein
MYPTCSGPRNPFLSVLLPLAMRNDVVFNSLLALSGVQRWDHYDFAMERETLRLRHCALKGCRLLLEEDNSGVISKATGNYKFGNHTFFSGGQDLCVLSDLDSMDEEKALVLLTSSALFLVYEKVSGEPNWKPHFDFMNLLFSHFFKRFISDSTSDVAASSETTDALRFLHHTFLYNDLVRSTSLRTATLSDFYLKVTLPGSKAPTSETQSIKTKMVTNNNMVEDAQSRYYFPNLVARISSGDKMVTDADIVAWNGNLEWLPSFSLMDGGSGSIATISPDFLPYPSSPESFWHNMHRDYNEIDSWDEQTIITELYSTAIRIYRRQVTGSETSQSKSLASWAMQLVRLLPEGSAFENALLWPIGIAAKDLVRKYTNLREYILSRLYNLERRFQMRHFRQVQDVLISYWAMLDSSAGTGTGQSVLASEVILLG